MRTIKTVEKRAESLINELKMTHPSFSIYFLQIINSQMKEFVDEHIDEIKEVVKGMKPWQHESLMNRQRIDAGQVDTL